MKFRSCRSCKATHQNAVTANKTVHVQQPGQVDFLAAHWVSEFCPSLSWLALTEVKWEKSLKKFKLQIEVTLEMNFLAQVRMVFWLVHDSKGLSERQGQNLILCFHNDCTLEKTRSKISKSGMVNSCC